METMRQDCDILSTRQTETARECVDACSQNSVAVHHKT